jgi:hypothetical protein
MERCFCIAGLNWRIVTEEPWEPTGLLSSFETGAEHWDLTLEYRLCDELPEPEGTLIYEDPGMRAYDREGVQLRYGGSLHGGLEHARYCIRREGKLSRVFLRRSATGERLSAHRVLDTMELEHRVVEHSGFVLHASWIERAGRGILFTAPSGTGKSTQAELWRSLRGARILNGDRAAVFAEPRAQVRGIPFCGSSGIGLPGTTPLEAIVVLSQAKENHIRRLRGLEAFRRIWEGCSVNVWNREDLDRCARTVTQVLEQVPVYHLACTPDEDAVRTLEKVLEKGVKP